MPTDKYLNKIVLNKMTREQFENLTVKKPDEFYAITDKDSELNNPFSLLDYKFSEYELNNISWLRSQGQYNSKAIYPAVYDLLLKIYNGTETKAGVSVKLSTEAYKDTDFVLNTADTTFRLPMLSDYASTPDYSNGFSRVKDVEYTAEVSGWVTFYLQNGTGNPFEFVIDGSSVFYNPREGNHYNTYPPIFIGKGQTYKLIRGGTVGAYTFYPCKNNGSLYFYVGETVQNANLINAGRIEEKLVDKVDYANTRWAINACMPDYTAGVSVSYTDLNSGYKAPYDGVLLCNFGLNGTIKINSLSFTTQMDYPNRQLREIHLNKGDVIKTTTLNSTYGGNNMFFPLKGDSNA